jgi:hypothetical protein
MSPITHFLASWVVFERFQVSRRDRALVVLAGVLPDVDGLGIVADFATRVSGLPPTEYYQMFHRFYCHGLLAACVIAVFCGLCANAKWRVACCAFLCVHLHFLCDLAGSRGTMSEDLWGLYYWGPFTHAGEIVWSGQWPLVGWQNFVLTAALLAVVLKRAISYGYSPLQLFSLRADRAFVTTLRRRLAVWNDKRL